MRDSEGFENAAALLPQDMRAQLMELPEPLRTGAEELRLRSGRRLSLLLAEGESPVGARPVQPRDLDTVLENATRASAHTALESVASGFVTVRGGCRVGLCGETVVREGGVRSIRRLSSLGIRIPRQHRGCAAGSMPGCWRPDFRTRSSSRRRALARPRSCGNLCASSPRAGGASRS